MSQAGWLNCAVACNGLAKPSLAVYTRRCRVETIQRELKQMIVGIALTLRSRAVEGVYQEIWGALMAYLMRLE